MLVFGHPLLTVSRQRWCLANPFAPAPERHHFCTRIVELEAENAALRTLNAARLEKEARYHYATRVQHGPYYLPALPRLDIIIIMFMYGMIGSTIRW
eukprot:COSAG01_NODE_17825_length_1121_cov_1.958904_2_plen_97_part_00